MRTFKSPKKRLEPKQLPTLHRYTVKHPDGRLFHCEATSVDMAKRMAMVEERNIQFRDHMQQSIDFLLKLGATEHSPVVQSMCYMMDPEDDDDDDAR